MPTPASARASPRSVRERDALYPPRIPLSSNCASASPRSQIGTLGQLDFLFDAIRTPDPLPDRVQPCETLLLFSDRLVTMHELQLLVRRHRTTLNRWVRAGLFPPRHRVGTLPVGWRLSEVNQWLAGKWPAPPHRPMT